MKNYFKSKAIKSSISILGMLFIMSAAVNAADITEYLNDGHISFAGERKKASKDTDVTISVVKSAYDYDDETQWKKAEAENVVYYGNSTISAEGKYDFNFTLDENGLYDIYIGFENTEAPDIFRIEYTNRTGNEAAVKIFKEAIQSGSKTDIEQLLRNNRNDLRIYTDLYSDEACSAAAELVYDYFKGLNNSEMIDGNLIKEITQRAFAVDKLNNKSLISIEQYKDILKLSDGKLARYYNSENESEIKNVLQQTQILSIEEYDNRLTEAVIISAINHCDGIQIIKDALTDFKEECGTSNKSITDNLCSAIANKGNFKSLAELKTFVLQYDDNKGSGTTGGNTYGGSSGNSGTSAGKGGGGIIAESNSEKNNNIQTRIFNDVSSDFWANEAIEALYKKSIAEGKTNSMFYPNDNIKREEFVTLLVKAFKFDMVDNAFYFEDVPEDAWYYDYVRSAYLGYVVNGISETMFGSGADITRQDLSVMIYNAAKSAEIILPETEEKVDFNDETDIAEYAKPAVESLQKAGIISGYENNTFKPRGNATRAEAAMMIYRVMQYIK